MRLFAAVTWWSCTAEDCLKDKHPASEIKKASEVSFLGTRINSPKLTLKTLQTVSQKTKHQGAYLAFFPIEKPLSFLAGSVLPLLAQNLSTPLLMTLPEFFTTSSSPGDEPTFSKSLEVFPLRIFELLTTKYRNQTPQKQSTPPIFRISGGVLNRWPPRRGTDHPHLYFKFNNVDWRNKNPASQKRWLAGRMFSI